MHTCLVASIWLALSVPLTTARAQDAPPRFGASIPERAVVEGLSEPRAAAVHASGEVFVAEAFAQRIVALKSDRNALRVLTSGPGRGAGQLSEPSGLALAKLADGSEVLFVSDTGNHRIALIALDGLWMRSFGARGARLGELGEPLGLSVRNGRVYVADSLNDRVQVFDLDGRPLAAIGRHGRGEGELAHPADVDVDSVGNVYVADVGNQRIAVFDPQGKHLRTWGGFGPHAGLLHTPSGIEVFHDEVYVADRDNHRVQVFNALGELVHEWGLHALLPREGNGKLHYPNQLTIAPDGAFALLVEGFEDRLQAFGPREAQEKLPPMERNTAAHYAGGCAVAGILLAVLEPTGPSVSLYDLAHSTPIEITRFGSNGAKPGQLLQPVDAEFDKSGDALWVSDAESGRISLFRVARKPDEELRYDPTLAKLVLSVDVAAITTNPPGTWPIQPGALALASNGEMYVADTANARVVVFDAQWKPLRVIGKYGTGAGEFLRPTELALRAQGGVTQLVATDARAGRVQCFEASGKHLWSAHEGLTRPYGVLAAADGALWVSDEAQHALFELEPSNGRVKRAVGTVGTRGLGKAEFCKPHGLAQAPNGRIFAIDHGNHRFQMLDSDGKYADMWGARLFTEAGRAK